MFRVRNGDKEHVSWKGEQNGKKDAEGEKVTWSIRRTAEVK
jgi:hypothetical protein